MNTKISFIILSWNSKKYLDKCLNSIIKKCSEERLSFEIIVIDNGSYDKSQIMINAYQERYPDIIKKIFLEKNMGTTYPRNQGLKQAKGDYVCIMDSDAEIMEGSMQDVLNVLSNKPDIGIVAPQLLLPNGLIQNSVKKFPNFLNKIVKVPKAIFKLPVPNNDFYDNFPFESTTIVDTAISACWFYKRNLHRIVGFLDENIFYAPEDLDFCLRVWEKGLKVIYYPKLKVLHNTQQISHRSSFSKLSLSHFLGILYYFRKHGSWFSTTRLYRRIRQNNS